MNGKQAFFAMVLGDVVKRELEGFTSYFFGLSTLEEPDPFAQYPVKRIDIHHTDDPAYNVWVKHNPRLNDAPFADGPVFRRFSSFQPNTFTGHYERCTDAEAKLIKQIWNWEYQDTKHACPLPEVY